MLTQQSWHVGTVLHSTRAQACEPQTSLTSKKTARYDLTSVIQDCDMIMIRVTACGDGVDAQATQVCAESGQIAEIGPELDLGAWPTPSPT